MTNPPQPDCLLVNAAGAAYTILPGQTWCPPTGNQYYDAVPWTGTPVAVVGGANDTDAALVGAATVDLDSQSQTAVVVAFRGTLPMAGPAPLPDRIYDWLVNDLLGTFDLKPIDGFGAAAKVHRGFWNATNAIWPGLQTAIADASDGHDVPVVITGHSKGGPMATLCAVLMHQAGMATPQVTTFASPHPGNAAFAAGYNALLTQRRWEFAKDLVPLLPPIPEVVKELAEALATLPDIGHELAALIEGAEKWDYAPVGKLLYIDSSGNETPLSLSELHRLEVDIIPEIVAHGFGALGAAHCCTCAGPHCDGGYQSGVCEGTCC